MFIFPSIGNNINKKQQTGVCGTQYPEGCIQIYIFTHAGFGPGMGPMVLVAVILCPYQVAGSERLVDLAGSPYALLHWLVEKGTPNWSTFYSHLWV